MVAHHILGGGSLEADALDVLEDLFRIGQAGMHAARRVDLGAVAGDDHARALAQTGQEHLHLHGGGVLRLVQNHEGIRQRAAAHEGQGRDLDALFLHQLLHLLRGQEIVQRVVKRLHIGIDLFLHVAGQKAQTLIDLDGGARPG